jgi:ubiquinone/menaquinone biosynthesis C-methylase UbiE
MIIRNYLGESPAFCFKNNIFYQQHFDYDKSIEGLYQSLRKKENRVYSDDMLNLLPQTPSNHMHEKEWKQRQFTLKRLLPYLGVKESPKILELGCGNGWLCNHLAALSASEVVGVDISEPELTQAAAVFKSRQNLCFVHGDISTLTMPGSYFDYIIFAASIQYFANLESLFKKAFTLLATDGEIHVVDSPIYTQAEAPKAQKRSREYFYRSGFPEMSRYYFHHTWIDLKTFGIKKQYNPDLFFNKVMRKLSAASPFPWVIVTKRQVFYP